MCLFRTIYYLALASVFCFNLAAASEVKLEDQADSDWYANFSLGVGHAKYMNHLQSDMLHSSFSLRFQPIQALPQLKAKFKIMTQSPTQEEDGFLAVPLRSYDFSQVTELWLKYQIFSHLLFQVGKFPDTLAEMTPISWPYYSIYTKLDLLKGKQVNLNVLARHDILSVYSYQSNKSTASNVERTRVELILDLSQPIAEYKLFLHARTYYDFFSDPDSTLSSLTYGREQYIENPVTEYNQKYRILTYSGILGIENDILQSKVLANYWSNLIAKDYSFGKFFGFAQRLKLGQTSLILAIYQFNAEQNAAPPSFLSANYYPGFEITAVQSALIHKFTEQIRGTIDFRYQHAGVYGQSNIESKRAGDIPNIPKYKILFMLEYLFDSFTTKDILTRQ